MKLKFKLLTIALALTVLSVNAEDFTKEIHQGFDKDAIQSLKVSNKYGEVKINDWGGDSITVDVLITVETSSEKKAEYLFEQIEIEIQKQGSQLVLETDIRQSFKTKQNFAIDYRINIPNDRDLWVKNKYGNVFVNSLDANGNFEIAYGNINTGELMAPESNSIQLELAYSKADIESFNSMVCEIKYSKLFVGEADALISESRYSSINIEEISSLKLDSKYDGVKVEELDELRANSKYTNYKISELGKKLVLDTEYGSVRVGEVSEGFELIDITNSYGGISIGLDDLPYNLDADCDYCSVKLSEGSFSGTRKKDNQHLTLEGTVNGGSATSKVNIRSRYGGVKLAY